MVFWKIDDETIRCLINKQEIDSMGYDLQALSNDTEQMEAFLEAIVQSSRNYIDWHTENGVQNYIARALPADQFLITISCTFQDDIIDRNLDQIKRMTLALSTKISEDRLAEIYALSGEEKEKAFEQLTRDLQAVCMGADENGKEVQTAEGTAALQSDKSPGHNIKEAENGDSGRTLPGRKLVFQQFDELLAFCSMLDERFFYESSLYKEKERYVLLVEFGRRQNDGEAVAFVLMAEEYSAKCGAIRLDQAYLSEHGQMMIERNAIEVLHDMN